MRHLRRLHGAVYPQRRRAVSLGEHGAAAQPRAEPQPLRGAARPRAAGALTPSVTKHERLVSGGAWHAWFARLALLHL
eukprot:6178373-Pleurochrysis_carterae.AAC.1